jgi:predicted TIM-barrel fold metal-dependent hydrolase
VSGTVDCDVHCAPPTIAALGPYLPDHWVEFLRWTNFDRLRAVEASYPAWAPMFAGEPPTLEDVQRDVLGQAELAIVHCFAGLESVHNPFLSADLATAVNRWLQAEWLDRDDRLLASAVLAPQHTEEAVDEVGRIADDPRFVQVLLPGRAVEAYGNKRFWPIWDAAAEAGLALAINLGGVSGTPPTSVNWLDTFFEDYTVGVIQFQMHLASLLYSGVFDRHPDLQVVLLESGCSWMPATIWRFDREYKEARREVPWMKELPADYIRRHVRMTIAPFDQPPHPEALSQVLDALGTDEMLLYSSDYTHRYAVGPGDILEALTLEQKERVLWQNAAACYRARTSDLVG